MNSKVVIPNLVVAYAEKKALRMVVKWGNRTPNITHQKPRHEEFGEEDMVMVFRSKISIGYHNLTAIIVRQSQTTSKTKHLAIQKHPHILKRMAHSFTTGLIALIVHNLISSVMLFRVANGATSPKTHELLKNMMPG